MKSSRIFPDISVVVPVYQEEGVIPIFLERLRLVLTGLTENFEVIFCLDPGSDNSENLILNANAVDPRIKLLKFSRRFGQPAATIAGLSKSTGKKVVVIDADLQDPPEVINQLNEKMDEGFDVVYATRRNRQGETIFKKAFTHLGYKLINSLSDIQIPRNTGDFRIMSRRVVIEICALQEKHGFLRGLVGFVGYNQSSVFYDRDVRFAGDGKYNRNFGSLKIGLNGLIGFSAKPLNFMALFGGIIAGFSFLLGAWYAGQRIFGATITPGLSTTVILISFFAGVQLLSLGLVGEYISRIYDEVKNRPMYIVENQVGFDE